MWFIPPRTSSAYRSRRARHISRRFEYSTLSNTHLPTRILLSGHRVLQRSLESAELPERWEPLTSRTGACGTQQGQPSLMPARVAFPAMAAMRSSVVEAVALNAFALSEAWSNALSA